MKYLTINFNNSIKAIFLTCLIISGSDLKAQKHQNSQDSIKAFYNRLFFNLESTYMHKNKVDWKSIKAETEKKFENYSNFENSLTGIRPFFDSIYADHCGIYYKDKHYTATPKPILNLVSEEWKIKYASKPGFEVKLIGDDIGYILIPRIIIFDSNEKKIRNAAQPIYDEITKLKTKKDLKGWIIDLRFNTGGNCIPMLLALSDFLGNNNVWGSVDSDLNKQYSFKLDNGIYYANDKRQASIKRTEPSLEESKVALIIGPATASSGEIVALSFKERSNTILIGENSYGATTANSEISLPYGAVMALTSGIDTDRSGKIYNTVVPDVIINKQDNFDNLLLDKKIEKAISYFKES